MGRCNCVRAILLCTVAAGCVSGPDKAISDYLSDNGGQYRVSVSEFLERETANLRAQNAQAAAKCLSEENPNSALTSTLQEQSKAAGQRSLASPAMAAARRVLGELADDRVIQAALVAQTFALDRAIYPDASRSMALAAVSEPSSARAPATDYLSVEDFRQFANKVANALPHAQPSGNVAEGSPSQGNRAIAPTLGDFLAGEDSASLASQQKSASATNDFTRREVLAFYLKEYYQGKFHTRFGDESGKPEMKSGIGNSTIAGFTTVLMEAVMDLALQGEGPIFAYADQPLPREIVGGKETPLPTKFFPAGTSAGRPTATLLRRADKPEDAEKEAFGTRYYFGTKKVTETGKDDPCGITAAETRAVQFLSNYFADRFIVWSGGLFELLNTVDVGFVVGSGFAVGDNETVATVAKAALEVIARRSAETFLYARFTHIPDRGYADEFLRLFQEEKKEKASDGKSQS